MALHRERTLPIQLQLIEQRPNVAKDEFFVAERDRVVRHDDGVLEYQVRGPGLRVLTLSGRCRAVIMILSDDSAFSMMLHGSHPCRAAGQCADRGGKPWPHVSNPAYNAARHDSNGRVQRHDFRRALLAERRRPSPGLPDPLHLGPTSSWTLGPARGESDWRGLAIGLRRRHGAPTRGRHVDDPIIAAARAV